jgi:molybdopterin-guanine dinucleotide biosynthesis protein A
MQRDKAALHYGGKSQLDRAIELAARHVPQVFVSVRPSQIADPARARRPLIVDSVAGEGPIVGIRSALAANPHVAWLVLACDLPFLSDAALSQLLSERDPSAVATAYRSAHDGLPEPLCAIWEPAAAAALAAHPQVAWLVLACDLPFLSDAALSQLLRERDPTAVATAYRSAHDGLPEPLCAIWEPSAAAALAADEAEGMCCPRKFLIRQAVPLLEPRDPRALDNINTPEEYSRALASLDAS